MKKLMLVIPVMSGVLWGSAGIFVRTLSAFGFDNFTIITSRFLLAAVILFVGIMLQSGDKPDLAVARSGAAEYVADFCDDPGSSYPAGKGHRSKDSLQCAGDCRVRAGQRHSRVIVRNKSVGIWSACGDRSSVVLRDLQHILQSSDEAELQCVHDNILQSDHGSDTDAAVHGLADDR